MIEPSDYERAALPETTAQYVADLEAIVEALPKCWRLKDGVLVCDATPSQGQRLYIVWNGRLKSGECATFVDIGSVYIHPGVCFDTEEAAWFAEEHGVPEEVV